MSDPELSLTAHVSLMGRLTAESVTLAQLVADASARRASDQLDAITREAGERSRRYLGASPGGTVTGGVAGDDELSSADVAVG